MVHSERNVFPFFAVPHVLVAGLALISGLACITWLLTWFFINSDGIFYLARQITSAGDFLATLSRLDDRGNFRPLTYWVASGILIPIADMNIVLYRVLAMSVHFMNVLLAFRLIRKLTGSFELAALTSLFFGLHFVAFHVGYGMVCLPDLCYVFFTLLACILHLDFLEKRSAALRAATTVAFLAALLSKETAAVVPLLLLVLSWLSVPRPGRGLNSLWAAAALRATLPCWLLLVLYLAYFAFLNGGSLTPKNPEHPYAVNFSGAVLAGKMPYLAWTANLPLFGTPRIGPSLVLRQILEEISLKNAGAWAMAVYDWMPRIKLAAYLAWIPTLAVLFFRALRCGPSARLVLFCLALIASLGPVAFLTRKVMPHNVYLAALGLAFWVSLGLAGGSAPAEKGLQKKGRLGIALAVAAFLIASTVSLVNEIRRSWLTHASLMAHEAVYDVARQLPHLEENAVLYFQRSADGGLPWYYDGGNLFRVWFQKPKLKVLFEDRRDPLPPAKEGAPAVHVFRAQGIHLLHVTNDFRTAGMSDPPDLTRFMDLKTLQVNRDEYYPRYDSFDTPDGRAGFFINFHRMGETRRSVILLGGASVTGELPEMNSPAKIRVSFCHALDSGDGVVARMLVLHKDEWRILFSREVLPARRRSERRWFQELVDVSEFAGKPFTLMLQCLNRPGNRTEGDWIAWSLQKPSDSPLVH